MSYSRLFVLGYWVTLEAFEAIYIFFYNWFEVRFGLVL